MYATNQDKYVGDDKSYYSGESKSAAPNMQLASVESRFISYIFDRFVVVVIGMIFAFTFGVVFGADMYYDDLEIMGRLIAILVAIGYYTYYFGEGQTPGMKVMKIKLCRTDGTYPVGCGTGFARWLVMNISGIVLFLGYFWILIDKNNQAWHDKIADTYVVQE